MAKRKDKKPGKQNPSTKALYQELPSLEAETPEEMLKKLGGAAHGSSELKPASHTVSGVDQHLSNPSLAPQPQHGHLGSTPTDYVTRAECEDKIAAHEMADQHFREARIYYQYASEDWSQAAAQDHGNKQYLTNSTADTNNTGEADISLAHQLVQQAGRGSGFIPPDMNKIHEARDDARRALHEFKEAGSEFSSLEEYNRAGESFENASHASEFRGNWRAGGMISDQSPELMETAGQYFEQAGNHVHAAQDFQQAASLFQGWGNYNHAAQAYEKAGQSYDASGHYNEAKAAYEQAGASYNAAAENYNSNREFGAAAQDYANAAQIFAQQNNWRQAGAAENNAAANYSAAGNTAEAIDQYQQAGQSYVNAAMNNEPGQRTSDMQQATNSFWHAVWAASGSEKDVVMHQAKESMESLAKSFSSNGTYAHAAIAYDYAAQYAESAVHQYELYEKSGDSYLHAAQEKQLSPSQSVSDMQSAWNKYAEAQNAVNDAYKGSQQRAALTQLWNKAAAEYQNVAQYFKSVGDENAYQYAEHCVNQANINAAN
jgi:hypothetical protein